MRRTIMFHNDQLPLNDMLLMCRLLHGDGQTTLWKATILRVADNPDTIGLTHRA
jgi:hypothetical protein